MKHLITIFLYLYSVFALEIGDVQFPVNALGHITAHEHTYKRHHAFVYIYYCTIK